jgi:hypothetical protein
MRLLMVHGMGRTSLSLARLARFLQGAGHQVERVGYLAAVEPFDRIQRRVRLRLESLARSQQPYGIIGHSLGGLALRAALHELEPAPVHLFMLGTPNQPPRLARRLSRRWLYRLLCGESGQLLARDDFFARLPPLTVPYTIVAGTAGFRGRLSPFGHDVNDWIVAVEETKVRPADQPMVLPVGHTFMMNDRRVQMAIRRVLDSVAV